MRLWAALTVVGVTWFLAACVAVRAPSIWDFLGLFAVQCLCGITAAFLLEELPIKE